MVANLLNALAKEMCSVNWPLGFEIRDDELRARITTTSYEYEVGVTNSNSMRADRYSHSYTFPQSTLKFSTMTI